MGDDGGVASLWVQMIGGLICNCLDEQYVLGIMTLVLFVGALLLAFFMFRR